MSEEANKEQTKGAKQENITSDESTKEEANLGNKEDSPELSDEQMGEASAGYKVIFYDLVSSSFQTGGSSALAEDLTKDEELKERVDNLGTEGR